MRFHRITALLLKFFFISINRIDRLFDIFYWPLIDVVVWGFASAYIEDLSSFNIISMLLGGIILWVFVWRASQDIAVYVLEDFWSRSLYHLFSSPVRLSEHLIAVILLGFVRALMTFGVLLILAFILYSFQITVLPFHFIAIAIFLLSLFGWAMGLFVTSMILLFGQRIQVLAWSSVWVIQPFSCVMYPLSSLPAWALPIAKALPTTYIFENLRNILFQHTIVYSQLWLAFLLDIIFLIVMILLVRWAFERARLTGLLAKVD